MTKRLKPGTPVEVTRLGRIESVAKCGCIVVRLLNKETMWIPHEDCVTSIKEIK